MTSTLQAVDTERPVCSRDCSIPTSASPRFAGCARFDVAEQSNHVIICGVPQPGGTWTYLGFGYTAISSLNL